jgi:hypothetical protein
VTLEQLVKAIAVIVREYAAAPELTTPHRLSIDLVTREMSLTIIAAPLPAPAAPAPVVEVGRGGIWMSNEERDIVAVLDRTNWKTRKQISAATGLPPEGDLKVLLRNLVARSVLESSTSLGYRLTAGVPEKGDEAL